MNKKEYVDALRELADFVESREFPDEWQNSWGGKDCFQSPGLQFWARTKSDFAIISSAMGSFEKDSSENYLTAKKNLPKGAYVCLDANKETTCVKKVVGKKIIPATDEEIIPAKPEREEDIVEWECPESFIALKETV